MSETPEHSPEHIEVVDGALGELAHLPGALLPILHRIQGTLGWIPPASAPRIAKVLNLSVAEIQGVISFYHDFRSAPPGRRVVKLCRAEACQAMGAEALAAHVKDRLGVDFHQTRADGEVTLEPAYCLGNCACAPALLLNAQLHGRVNPGRFDRIWEGSES